MFVVLHRCSLLYTHERPWDMLQQTATHCSTPVNIYGTCCNTLQHTCNTQTSTRHASEQQDDAQQRTSTGHAATHCKHIWDMLQHTCNTRTIYGTCKRTTAWRTATNIYGTCCNTQQHTATHTNIYGTCCNTLPATHEHLRDVQASNSMAPRLEHGQGR